MRKILIVAVFLAGVAMLGTSAYSENPGPFKGKWNLYIEQGGTRIFQTHFDLRSTCDLAAGNFSGKEIGAVCIYIPQEGALIFSGDIPRVLVYSGQTLSQDEGDKVTSAGLASSRIDRLWELTKHYLKIASAVPPPVYYVDADLWEKGKGTYGEYFKDKGMVEIYRTLWTAEGEKLASQYVYAVIAEELFHHALLLRGLSLSKHHCAMVINGFWIREGGSFVKLLCHAETEGVISKEAGRWREERVNSVCTEELKRLSR